MNLLATKWGRLLTFFLLYITEGIPLGFTATVMAQQMRRGGMGTDEIGLFVGSLYLPWGYKWVAGPFVDLIYSNRFGRRRAWIVVTQVLMVATLMACMPFDLVKQIEILGAILLIHNSCSAVQDVAIDALACETLRDEERGLGNGFMFAGASVGQALGGAGVLYFMQYLMGAQDAPKMDPTEAFRMSYWFVGGMLIAITLFVSLQIREPVVPRTQTAEGAFKNACTEVVKYAKTAKQSFISSQTAFVGLLIASLPAGALALSLPLQSNMAVELGFGLTDIADLALYTTITQAFACPLGGLLSDRLGRRRTLAACIILCSIPTAWFGFNLQQHDWIMPAVQRKPAAASQDGASQEKKGQDVESSNAQQQPEAGKESETTTRKPPKDLVTSFWACSILYSIAYGLLLGSQIPVFMEITNPAVAATQFTAYMALHNLVTAYTSAWQGYAMAEWGYPKTLWLDAALGLIGIALFPFLKLQKRTEEEIAKQRDADLGHPA